MKYSNSRKSINSKSTNFLVTLNMILNVSVILCCIALVPLLFYLLVIKSGYFNIEKIQVNGTKQFVNRKDLNALASSRAFDKNLVFFNTASLEIDLSNSFQGARRIKITRDFPNTLIVDVEERKPFAIINKNVEEKYLVDQEGYVLGFADKNLEGLPSIKYSDEIRIGGFIPKHLIPMYLEILNVSKDEGLKVSSISATSNYVSIYANNVIALLSFDKDRTNSITVLSKLLRQLSVEGKKPKKIDLRFDKVIVSYE